MPKKAARVVVNERRPPSSVLLERVRKVVKKAPNRMDALGPLSELMSRETPDARENALLVICVAILRDYEDHLHTPVGFVILEQIWCTAKEGYAKHYTPREESVNDPYHRWVEETGPYPAREDSIFHPPA